MVESLPVIHANENDWLAKFNGPRDNTSAIVSAEPNFKMGLKRRKKRLTRRIHRFRSHHHESTGVDIYVSYHGNCECEDTHHSDGKLRVGCGTGGSHNVYGQASRIIQLAENGKEKHPLYSLRLWASVYRT